MYLVNDLVKFRDHDSCYYIKEIDDELIIDDENCVSDPRYKVVNTETGREYSFWVRFDDLEYIPTNS